MTVYYISKKDISRVVLLECRLSEILLWSGYLCDGGLTIPKQKSGGLTRSAQ